MNGDTIKKYDIVWTNVLQTFPTVKENKLRVETTLYYVAMEPARNLWWSVITSQLMCGNLTSCSSPNASDCALAYYLLIHFLSDVSKISYTVLS